MSIQGEINQAISVMGLILPQTVYGQNIQDKRRTKKLAREAKSAVSAVDAIGENPKVPPWEVTNLGNNWLNKERDLLLLKPNDKKIVKEYAEAADFVDNMGDIANLEASEKRERWTTLTKKEKKPKVEEPKTTITPAATATPTAETKPAAEKKPIEEKKPAPQTSSFEKKLTGQYDKNLYNKQYNEALERRKQEMNRMQSNTNRVATLTAKPAPATTPAPTAPAAKPATATPTAAKPASAPAAKSTAPQPISPKPTQSAAQQKLNSSFANSFNEALARAQKIQAGGKK